MYTLLYYIGGIYRGEEKGYLPKKGEGEVFRGGNRGENRDLEGDKLKNRWGIDGSWTGNQTRVERELNEN